MKQILIYADSLSWGIIPDTRNRLPFDKRWPGIFETALKQSGKSVRVIEDCLNGRRTTWDDPFKAGRNGAQHLSQVIEMHSPLALVILMLGTNDFQRTHDNNAWLSAQGTAKLIQIVQQAPIEPDMPTADILIIAPPNITQPKGLIAPKFEGAEKRCIGLPAALEAVSANHDCHYFDANSVTVASAVDGIHLDAPEHQLLGQAIAKAVLDKAIF